MLISLHVFEDDTVAKVTVSKANLDEFCFGLLGPAPFFVASLFCFEAKRKSGWGICGSFLVVLLVFVWFCFRDDLPKFLDHTCPCTLLLFTAYAIVRTEPSATSAKPEEKKEGILYVTILCHNILLVFGLIIFDIRRMSLISVDQ